MSLFTLTARHSVQICREATLPNEVVLSLCLAAGPIGLSVVPRQAALSTGVINTGSSVAVYRCCQHRPNCRRLPRFCLLVLSTPAPLSLFTGIINTGPTVAAVLMFLFSLTNEFFFVWGGGVGIFDESISPPLPPLFSSGDQLAHTNSTL